mgnify:FL=1
MSITNDAPTTFNLGETIVTWTVSDGVGNTSTTTQIVNITDDTPPVISETSGDFAVSCQLNNINIGNPEVNDNCGILSITNNEPEEYNIGENVITWIATDINGNTAEYYQTISVVNSLVPTAICNDISLTLEEGIAVISALDIDDGSYDQCGEVELSISQTEFDESHIGDNTVILTVTDNSGNTSTCEATVTVEAGLNTEENYLIDNISIYPNPTSEMIFIKSNFSCDYELFNMIGQKIISGKN